MEQLTNDRSITFNEGELNMLVSAAKWTKYLSILGFIGMVLGFSLAAIPINADVKFQGGNSTANLTQLMEASKTLGSTSIHIGKTLDNCKQQQIHSSGKRDQ